MLSFLHEYCGINQVCEWISLQIIDMVHLLLTECMYVCSVSAVLQVEVVARTNKTKCLFCV